MASKACDAVMSAIKTSQLDFVIQETPYSSFVTIRKKFQKGFNPRVQVAEIKTAENHMLEEVHLENGKLKEVIKEKESQLELTKENSILLQEKLEKAEKDILKLHEENAKQKAIFAEELSILKAQIKEKGDEILVYKVDAVKLGKTIKSLEKEVHNCEKKTSSLEEKIETLNVSKAEIKKERDRLLKDVKNLTKNSKKMQIFETLAVQTECVPENNNISQKCEGTSSSRAPQTVCRGSQTSSSSEVSFSVIGEHGLQTFDCVVCDKTFLSADSLQVHVQSEHDLMLDLGKLTDHHEKDPFVRFLKSMEVGEEYIEERIKLYPSHWDHVGERVKFRRLAQIKLAITSK